jgi:parvulin-like peptidyl-prolyl isomerase
MTEIVQIGNFKIPNAELVPLLVRYQLLPGMLRELAIDRAIVAVECSETEGALAIQQTYERYQLTSNEQVQQWLDLQGLTRDQLEDIAIRKFKIEQFKQEMWGNKLEAYFLKRKGQLDRAIYSLIRTEDIGIAQEVYFRMIDGEQTFEDIARQYSQGAEAQTGGLIGPVELSTPHPAIAQLIATQSPGKICQPIKLDQWYVIVRPEQIIPSQLDEPMRQRMIDELFQTWLQEELRSAVAESPASSQQVVNYDSKSIADPAAIADPASLPNLESLPIAQ